MPTPPLAPPRLQRPLRRPLTLQLSAPFRARTLSGKAIFLIGSAVLRLLRADASAKLHLVNTGTRVLERSEPRPGVTFPFRLMQEGVAFVVPYMSRQRFFASTADILELLCRRSIHVAHFASEALKAALLAADAGCIAIVHDPKGLGVLADDQPLPLVLAAMRSPGDSPLIELVVKQAESTSLYNRMANLPVSLPPAAAPVSEPAAAAAAGTEAPVQAEGTAGPSP